MSLIYTPDLLKKLEDANVLLDTCVMIDASNSDDVDTCLRSLLENGCTFLTLPAIREEFTCSAKSRKDYENLSKYIGSFDIVFLNNTEKRLISDDNALFNIALGRCKNIHPSYVDRMLLSTPYLYRNSSEKIYLMTSNHKDVPLELFDRIGFITYDDEIFHNIGIYAFNENNFVKKIEKC